jgi:hypothetical protein
MDEITETKHLLTRAEAVKLLKKKRVGDVHFALHARWSIPVGEEHEFTGGGGVDLPRARAWAIAADYMTDRQEERGGRVPVTIRERRGEKYRDGEFLPHVWTTIWIG